MKEESEEALKQQIEELNQKTLERQRILKKNIDEKLTEKNAEVKALNEADERALKLIKRQEGVTKKQEDKTKKIVEAINASEQGVMK